MLTFAQVPTGSRDKKVGIQLTALVCVVAAATHAIWAIVSTPSAPIYDQAVLLRGVVPWPMPSDGLTARLWVQLWRGSWALDPSTLNTVVRCASAVAYLATAAWLATLVLSHRSSVALAILGISAAGFPTLWLSSELFVGASLCVAIGVIGTRQSTWIRGVALAVLAGSKPDLMLVAIALLIFVGREEPPTEQLRALAAVVAPWLLFVILGVTFHGLSYLQFDSWIGRRGFDSVMQHYAAMLWAQQLGARPDPWQNWSTYRDAVVPMANSLRTFIQIYPERYLDFVALSCAQSAARIVRAFGVWLVVAFVLAIWIRRQSLEACRWERLFLVAAVDLAPLVLLSFVHVRYCARFAPIIILFPLSVLERTKRVPTVASAALAIVFAIGVWDLIPRFIVDAPAGATYWFPD
jgi:hypothetical protein